MGQWCGNYHEKNAPPQNVFQRYSHLAQKITLCEIMPRDHS